MDENQKQQKFRAVYADHAQTILKYCLRRTNTSEQAADIVSETFLITWKKIDVVPEGKEAAYWLYSVARRVLANSYRKQANQEKLGNSLKEYLSTNEPKNFSDASVDKLVVDDALMKLDDAERELITLANWEGLKSREIGKILHNPAVTVRNKLTKIRKKLKIELQKNSEQFPDSRHI